MRSLELVRESRNSWASKRALPPHRAPALGVTCKLRGSRYILSGTPAAVSMRTVPSAQETSTVEPTPARPRWITWVTRISLLLGVAALIATVWIVGPDTILHYLRSIGWFLLVLIAIEMLSSALDGTAIYY